MVTPLPMINLKILETMQKVWQSCSLLTYIWVWLLRFVTVPYRTNWRALWTSLIRWEISSTSSSFSFNFSAKRALIISQALSWLIFPDILNLLPFVEFFFLVVLFQVFPEICTFASSLRLGKYFDLAEVPENSCSYNFILLWRKQVCFGIFYGKRRKSGKRKVNKAKRQVKRQKLWQLLFKSREMATSNNLDGLASSSSSSVGSEATKRPASSQETQVLDKKRLQVSYFLGFTSQDNLKPFHTYLSIQNSKMSLPIRNDRVFMLKVWWPNFAST